MATATKKKASKKASTKKATAKKATSVPKANDKRRDASARRGRGELEALVKDITDAYDAGKVELPEGKTLTPHRIAVMIEENGEEKPSPGAVSAILARWDEVGYALTHDKPFAYKKIAAKGNKKGLDTLKQESREAKRKAKAEAKA
jgi:hypothetical protein